MNGLFSSSEKLHLPALCNIAIRLPLPMPPTSGREFHRSAAWYRRPDRSAPPLHFDFPGCFSQIVLWLSMYPDFAFCQKVGRKEFISQRPCGSAGAFIKSRMEWNSRRDAETQRMTRKFIFIPRRAPLRSMANRLDLSPSDRKSPSFGRSSSALPSTCAHRTIHRRHCRHAPASEWSPYPSRRGPMRELDIRLGKMSPAFQH